MSHMKRLVARTSLAITAAIAPVAIAGLPIVALPSATAATLSAAEVAGDTPLASVEIGVETPNQDEAKTTWRGIIQAYNDVGFDNVKEISAWSPSMERYVPLVLIQPFDPAKRVDAPVLYLFNGADGGEGGATWLHQTDVITYYGGNDNPRAGVVSEGIGANIVIPMAGRFSYYSDWVSEPASLDGKQMWETFMTKELPTPLEQALDANGRRAIAGMSMTGTTVLNYAEHYPGFYDAVGSFSGCAATTTGLAPLWTDITLNRGGTSLEEMWGGTRTEAARYNDPMLNAEKLRGQENIYISSGSGLIGKHDVLSSPRIKGNFAAAAKVAVEGGVIEMATSVCTHNMRARTEALGIPVTYNFRPQGTHQWAYWQDDLRDFYPVLAKGLGTGAVRPANDEGNQTGDPLASLAPSSTQEKSLLALLSSTLQGGITPDPSMATLIPREERSAGPTKPQGEAPGNAKLLPYLDANPGENLPNLTDSDILAPLKEDPAGALRTLGEGLANQAETGKEKEAAAASGTAEPTGAASTPEATATTSPAATTAAAATE